MLEFTDYLEAKRSVDDRAMNRLIVDRLCAELRGAGRISVVDVGAGTGTGLERLLEWKVLTLCDYTAVDENRDALDVAESRLGTRVAGRYVASSLDAFSSEPENRNRFDLVLAQAFLDIVDLERSVESLVSLARPGGLLYLPITFDGETILEPSDPEDAAVLSAYHRTIPYDGRTGRRLFHALTRHTVEVLEIGSSDWVVYPHGAGGGYPESEALFLRVILEMIEEAVGAPATAWLERRRRQVDSGELVYIAHGLDALARKP